MHIPRLSSTLSAALLTASLSAATAAHAQPLEPATQTFIDGLAGAPPIYTLAPGDARCVLSSLQANREVALAPASVERRTLPVGPGGATSVHIVRPENAAGPLPAMVYLHGGGWVLGGFDTHERLVRELAHSAGVAVIFVDYTPSPEARFPVAIEQAYATLAYVADHAAALNIEPRRLAVAGDSVGGDMAAAITLLAKERKGPKIASQLLFYPVTDASMSTGSYAQFADGPWLTRKAMQWFWDQYLPDAAARANKLVSPINATADDLKGLPQALVITDENDVLRDEGETYARHLSAAGVRVTAVRYGQTIHDFVMLNPISQTPAARGAIAQATRFLRETLGR